MRLLASLQIDHDLLNPPKAYEAKLHKLTKLVQKPNSFFMDVKCPGCYQMYVPPLSFPRLTPSSTSRYSLSICGALPSSYFLFLHPRIPCLLTSSPSIIPFPDPTSAPHLPPQHHHLLARLLCCSVHRLPDRHCLPHRWQGQALQRLLLPHQGRVSWLLPCTTVLPMALSGEARLGRVRSRRARSLAAGVPCRL